MCSVFSWPVFYLISDLFSVQFSGSIINLQEAKGRAALYTGELRVAHEAFNKAKLLYQTNHDESALNRLEYFTAEVGLATGEISREEFVRTAYKVASNSYKQHDTFFGTQVELRLIEIGQSLTMQYRGLLKELSERSDELIARLEGLGNEYALIKASGLSSFIFTVKATNL